MHIGTKSTSRVHPHIWCPCTYLHANSSIYRAHAARGKRPRMSLEAVRTASGIHTRAHTSACLLSHKARTGVNQKWRLRPQSRRISKGAAYRRIALSLPRAGANWPLAGREKKSRTRAAGNYGSWWVFHASSPPPSTPPNWGNSVRGRRFHICAILYRR